MIIGVTGLFACGKDTFAKLLIDRNFRHISLSDMLRDECKKRGIEATRDNLVKVGNDLRERSGPAVLAKLALERVEDGENYVITSIRNPAEAKEILSTNEAIIVNVTAPAKVRFDRISKRGRDRDDPKTLSELRQKEKLEMSKDSGKQQLHKVIKLAKVTLSNTGTLNDLSKKTERLLRDYLYKLQGTRPSWDDYFMSIAEVVKLRATCMSAKKGAVLVKDKRIISTGYNGSPKGVKHCTAGGCQRCTSRHLGKIKSGRYTEPCVCCHSEENAIVQAAYHGISTCGATLYTTFTPCVNCSKMIINAGIREVVAKTRYPDDLGLKLFKQAGVSFRLYN